MTLRLYYSPIACSLVPYIALREAGAEFDVHLVNFAQAEHMSEDYLRINPKHKVPTLLIGDEVLTENVAILQWIAANYPAAKLLPVDGLEQFQAIAFLAWCAAGIHPHLTPNILPQRYCDLPDSADSVRRCAHKMLRENYQIAEDTLGTRDWFFDEFTVCDVYFFWCFRRGMLFNVDVAEYPRCRKHFDRVLARPSVQNLVHFEANAIEKLKQQMA